MIEPLAHTDMLTIEEAVLYRGCSKEALYARARDGRLPNRSLQYGKYLWTREELDRIDIKPTWNRITPVVPEERTEPGDAQPDEGNTSTLEQQAEKIYTRHEAAVYLGISPGAIYSLVYSKKLPDRRDASGSESFWFYESDLRARCAAKEQALHARFRPASSVKEAEPAPTQPATLSISADIALHCQMLTGLANCVPGIGKITSVKEDLPPFVRAWQVEVETATGAEVWGAFYRDDGFRFSRIDKEA